MTQDQRVRNQVGELLDGKSAVERALLVHGITNRLDRSDTRPGDRRAAEELARELAHDAMEIVRQELSRAIRRCRYLPKDIAMKLAHDVDSVACPFLEATEIFSEEDWLRLVRSISDGARVTVAQRADLSAGVTESLVEIGNLCTAETLIANNDAPISSRAYVLLTSRFDQSPWLFERMAQRPSLPADIAIQLISKISDAARQKLCRSHNLDEFSGALISDTIDHSMLRVIQDAHQDDLVDYARSLNQTGELGPQLLLAALKMGLIEFFETAMAVRAGIPVANAYKLTRSGGEEAILRLCAQAGIPANLRKNICAGVRFALAEDEHPSDSMN